MRPDEAFAIGRLDGHAQAALVRRREVSATELVRAAMVRIETLDSRLNAVSHRAFDLALARAAQLDETTPDSPLAGAPYLVKEGLDYPGMPTRYGSRAFRDARPALSGFPFVERLDDAGLVAVGKSAAPEFALLPSTEPILYGPTRNPWDLDRSSGGSSGGAASAVAAGLTPVAHAADGGGSIRIPAACCGVFGLKPSRHLQVRARAHHLVEDLLVGDALLSRSVRDAHWATNATASPSRAPAARSRFRPLRVALHLTSLEGTEAHPAVAHAMEEAARLCRDLGHQVEVVSCPVDGKRVARAFKVIWGYLAAEAAGHAPRRDGEPANDLLEPWTRDLALWSRSLEPRELERAIETGLESTRALGRFFRRYDVLLSPVVSTPPPLLGTLAPTRPFEDLMAAMFDYVGYTQLHNLAGTPAMSVPLAWTGDDLPLGAMFAAARGEDEMLFQLAYQLEEARPWAERWPKCTPCRSAAIVEA